MLIKTTKRNGKMYIKLSEVVNGTTYSQTYTCSFDEAKAQFKQWLEVAANGTH